MDGQASAVRNLGSPPGGFMSLLLLESWMAGAQCFWSTAWTQASYLVVWTLTASAAGEGWVQKTRALGLVPSSHFYHSVQLQ